MIHKLLSIIFALTAGWFIADIAWADPPFEVPVKGGIPQCMADLDACETDLSACAEDLFQTSAELTTCTTGLETCTTNLGTCSSDLDTCSTNLGSCTGELGTCNSELWTCGTDLITCTSNLTQTSDLLNICEVDLVGCQESTVVFPATGQTTCWTQSGVMIDCDVEAGEDGYFRAGGALAYIWNNDGTLVDVNTKLMWERKDMSGGIHDVRHSYRWVQSFREHIYALNNTCKSDETVDCSTGGDTDCEAALGAGEVCGFAGHQDWRMPNVKEMQSIIDYSQNFPAVSLAFKWMCGDGCSLMGETGCSCTSTGRYWTSTTVIGNPDRAWFVTSSGAIWSGFESSISDYYKYNEMNVRAVRGGL